MFIFYISYSWPMFLHWRLFFTHIDVFQMRSLSFQSQYIYGLVFASRVCFWSNILWKWISNSVVLLDKSNIFHYLTFKNICQIFARTFPDMLHNSAEGKTSCPPAVLRYTENEWRKKVNRGILNNLFRNLKYEI